MVEPTPSKDAFLVEHTDFSLREKSHLIKWDIDIINVK